LYTIQKDTNSDIKGENIMATKEVLQEVEDVLSSGDVVRIREICKKFFCPFFSPSPAVGLYDSDLHTCVIMKWADMSFEIINNARTFQEAAEALNDGPKGDLIPLHFPDSKLLELYKKRFEDARHTCVRLLREELPADVSTLEVYEKCSFLPSILHSGIAYNIWAEMVLRAKTDEDAFRVINHIRNQYEW